MSNPAVWMLGSAKCWLNDGIRGGPVPIEFPIVDTGFNVEVHSTPRNAGLTVDKTTFVEQAPYYYALAVVHYLDMSNDECTYPDISHYYSEHNEDENDQWYYLDSKVVFDRAVSWLESEGVIDVVDDHFGPKLLNASLTFMDARAKIERNVRAFSNYGKVRDKNVWLKQALKQVYKDWHSLKITEGDFLDPERDWSPIPLDRAEPELQSAISKVDNTIEQVRGDNGYAATHPEEHTHVLDGLRAASRRLKDGASISLHYLQTYALTPLALIVKRNGKAATGMAAEAALMAFREWLKQKGFDILAGLFK